MQPLAITAYTLTSAAGTGNQASIEALETQSSGLVKNNLAATTLDTWIGQVNGIEQVQLPKQLKSFDCRNNRLALFALGQDGFTQQAQAAIERYGADRVGLFLGTSTSGVEETEKAYAGRNPQTNQLTDEFDYCHTQNIFSVGNFIRKYLALTGPTQVVSTACSSSAKVFATASRYIEAGFCDAAIVGGVDTLCEMTLYGFNSLQLVSAQPCRPFDSQRNGISIGEAAGFALLEKLSEPGDVCLLGYGESSDAHHISSPHPEGLGAAIAMRAALQRASLHPDSVDYLNLHGTATPANDRSEDRAVITVLGADTPCSSTKGWTGHTLGAAGITEAIFCLLSMQHDFIPGTLNTKILDETIEINCLLENSSQRIHIAMSNSFGFGGSNCSLLFGTAL